MFRTIATAALFALSLTAAAQAGEASVHFGDLNLASPRDSETLKSRIAMAAAQSCGPVQLDFGVSASTIYQAGQERKACIARVSERLQAKVQVLAAKAATTQLARQ